jgi:hypothetical protein
MKLCCSMPPPRRCYEVIAISIFREGSRPSGCPRPMRRSWLQRNRLTETLRHTHPVPEGSLFRLTPYFSGEVSERRPWVLKREDRPADFAGRSKFRLLPLQHPEAYDGQVPIRVARYQNGRSTDQTNLTNKRGFIVRLSGGNIVTRYTQGPEHSSRQGRASRRRESFC